MFPRNGTSPDFASCRFASTGVLSAGIIINMTLVVLIPLKKVKWFRGILFAFSLCIADMVVAIISLSGQARVAFVTLRQKSEVSVVIRMFSLAAVYIQQVHLLVITYERFYACKYPLAFRSMFTDRKRYKILLAAWSAPSLVIACLSLIFSAANVNFMPLIPYTFSAGYLFTFVVISALYANIVQIKRHSGAIYHNASIGLCHHALLRRENRRLLLTSFGITGTYFVLNGPLMVLGLLGSTLAPCSTPFGLAMGIAMTLTSLNVVCDPLIYFLLATKRGRRHIMPPLGRGNPRCSVQSCLSSVHVTDSSRLQLRTAHK